MDLSSLEGDGQVDGLVLKEGKAHLILSSRLILNLFLKLRNHRPLLCMVLGSQLIMNME